MPVRRPRVPAGRRENRECGSKPQRPRHCEARAREAPLRRARRPATRLVVEILRGRGPATRPWHLRSRACLPQGRPLSLSATRRPRFPTAARRTASTDRASTNWRRARGTAGAGRPGRSPTTLTDTRAGSGDATRRAGGRAATARQHAVATGSRVGGAGCGRVRPFWVAHRAGCYQPNRSHRQNPTTLKIGGHRNQAMSSARQLCGYST